MRPIGILTALAALACASCSEHAVKSAANAHVTFAATAGNSVSGSLDLTTVSDGVRLQGQLAGLTPASTHGFHIHDKGDCSAPDGSSAGGHFNPLGAAHGNPSAMPHHAGDIPNQTADSAGVAKIDVVVHGVSVGTGASDDVIGRSMVVHKDRDDYTTQPAGNSGARVACGVIEKAG